MKAEVSGWKESNFLNAVETESENLPPFKECQNPSVLSQMKLSPRTRVFSDVC